MWVGPADAVTPQEQADQTVSKINDINGSVEELKAQIADDNRQIDALIGELSGLRLRAAELEAELAAKQAELDKVEAALEREREHLAEVRARLQRALDILEDSLVALYISGSPDIEQMVLASSDFGELVSNADYADAIQDRNETVVTRVETSATRSRRWSNA